MDLWLNYSDNIKQKQKIILHLHIYICYNKANSDKQIGGFTI